MSVLTQTNTMVFDFWSKYFYKQSNMTKIEGEIK